MVPQKLLGRTKSWSLSHIGRRQICWSPQKKQKKIHTIQNGTPGDASTCTLHLSKYLNAIYTDITSVIYLRRKCSFRPKTLNLIPGQSNIPKSSDFFPAYIWVYIYIYINSIIYMCGRTCRQQWYLLVWFFPTKNFHQNTIGYLKQYFNQTVQTFQATFIMGLQILVRCNWLGRTLITYV